ncbi:aldo/keto reductase [Polaromonas hydrogenivorans]|uniref:Aldo/keto reductase n=1 Tax=Polaromonas hydrogenivorans TaxID=335476 RepID=A0AAU7LY24_9BURK
MQYRQLGSSDLKVSVIGLGGNTFGPPRLSADESLRCIHRAGELGINFIDTAIKYGEGQSEAHIGRALEGNRHKWVVATKFNLAQLRADESVRARILRHCEISLQRLRSDYIDLYQIHLNAPGVDDEETLAVLAELVLAGKVRWIGECNYAAWRHAGAMHTARRHGWPVMVSCQNHYNLLRRHVEHETLPFCREQGVAFLPYFPLAGGFLTDKYVQGQPAPVGTRGAAGSPIVTNSRTARNEAIQSQLKEWAHVQGHSLGELAIAWLLSHPEIPSVIAGVSALEQVEQNVRAAEWVLTEAQRAEVDAIATWDGSGQLAEMLVP